MDEAEKMYAVDVLRSNLNHPLKKLTNFHIEDIGKIFVINPEKTSGRIMSRKEFLKLDLSEIGEWDYIDEFDVYMG